MAVKLVGVIFAISIKLADFTFALLIEVLMKTILALLLKSYI